MNNWTQISTFTQPHEAHLAKARLESEGIDVMIKDELTAQVYNFYSNAIGGVKLLVKDSDSEKAITILKDANILIDKSPEGNSLLYRFDKMTKEIPAFGKLILEFRLIILITILICVILFPIIILSLPSTKEKLTDGTWCLDSYYFQDKRYFPNTTNYLMIDFGDGCNETFHFSKNEVSLPGFNTPSINGYWEITNKKLTIFRTDTLSYLS